LQTRLKPGRVEVFAGPAFSVPGSSESARELVADRALATFSKSTSLNPIQCARCFAALAHYTLKVLPRQELESQAEYAGKEQADHMSLVTIVITLIVVGVLLWLVNSYIPMDGKIKKILNIVVVVVVVLWLLNVFGVLGNLRNIRASAQSPSLGTSICSVASPSGFVSNPAIVITS
jgi:hypothetical protein